MLKIIPKIKELNNLAESAPESVTNNSAKVTPEGTLELIKTFAPILIVALQIARIFTNDAADKKIDEIIAYLQGL